jgi:hypothetical protein
MSDFRQTVMKEIGKMVNTDTVRCTPEVDNGEKSKFIISSCQIGIKDSASFQGK